MENKEIKDLSKLTSKLKKAIKDENKDIYFLKESWVDLCKNKKQDTMRMMHSYATINLVKDMAEQKKQKKQKKL